MRKFVFWTGVYNIVGGVTFLIPGLPRLAGVKVPDSNFWIWGVALAVVYFGIALILCSRDLTGRASLVLWEGIWRIIFFALFAGFGFFGGLGAILGVLGTVDLLIGLAYLIWLPKALGTTAINLLLDRGKLAL